MDAAVKLDGIDQRTGRDRADGAMALDGSAGYHFKVQRSSWLTLVVLLIIGGIVVGSSLNTGAVRCEVCMDFGGRSACRSVDGTTREDAQMAAVTNACAFLASGVTDTMACQRTPPRRSACGPRDDPTE